MEMMNVMYELATTKSALEMAETTIRKQRGKLLRKNILIAGLLWFGFTACRMLGESDEKRKDAEKNAWKIKVALIRTQQALDEVNRKNVEQFWADDSVGEPEPEKDICCDGKASITKKPE